MTHTKAVGSRAEVWHGSAAHTSGGLTKKNLMKNKHGRIVSVRKHRAAKSARALVKAGYGTKKGHFVLFHKHSQGRRGHRGGTGRAVGLGNLGAPLNRAMNAASGGGSRRRRRRHRGGMALGGPLNPSAFDGRGVGTSGVALQMIAGQGN